MSYKFSNFLPYPKETTHFGVVLKTPEHYYQAEKTDDIDEKLMVLNAPTPGEAKRLGRKVTLVNNWEIIKTGVMYDAQFLKCWRDSAYMALVANADPEDFIEYNNHHDNIWGSCLCERCANVEKQNLLQKVLLELQSLWN